MKNYSFGTTFLFPLWVLLLIATFATASFSQNRGYRIDIRIDGMPDSVCYLANYYGDKTYLADTAFVDAGGSFVFQADTALPGGIYIVAGQSNNKYFELLVDSAQQFRVETSMSGIPSEMYFEGSSDNRLFYHYVNENIRRRQEIDRLTGEMKGMDPRSEEYRRAEERIGTLYDGLNMFEDSLIAAHPGTFVSAVLLAKREPPLAPPRYLADGREDSIFAYQSYKKHYWDNLDPADARLLRTPLYHKRLQRYFEEVVYQDPDTLIREADKFIARAGSDRDTYKYAVWYLTYKFETSNIMGFDEIFVHLVDSYYVAGKAYWTEESVVRSLRERADELRNVLIGSQAPNMILLDTAGGFQSLYSIPATYLIVLFYEYGCGHCRKEIAALQQWYPENAHGVKVFAVNTDTSLADWKRYIRKLDVDWVHVNGTRSITPDYHTLYDISVTPTIYLLDDRKKIIAKRLKTEQLIPFIEQYDRRRSRDVR